MHDIDDVDRDSSAPAIAGYPTVDASVVGGGDHHGAPVEVGFFVFLALDRHFSLSRPPFDLLGELRRHDRDSRPITHHRFGFSGAYVSAADDEDVAILDVDVDRI